MLSLPNAEYPAIVQTVYFGLLALVVESKCTGTKWLEYATKPLLMPTLGVLLYMTLRENPAPLEQPAAPLILALFFATIGDVCLMFPKAFLAGLGGFFLMQCTYIYMLWPSSKSTLLTPSLIAPTALLILSFVVQYSLVRRNLGRKTVPAVAYFVTFSIVLLLAVAGYISEPNAGITLLLGIFLFYVSDCLIALSRFRGDFVFSGGAIMLTYGIGQYLFLSEYVKRFLLP